MSVHEVEIEVLESRSEVLEGLLAKAPEGSVQWNALRMALWVVQGEYPSVLQHDIFRDMMLGCPEEVDANGLVKHIGEKANDYIEASSEEEKEWRQAICLFIGCASANYFAQMNWTGPEGSVTMETILPEHLKVSEKRIHSESVAALECNGEDCFRLVRVPLLLLVAESVLGCRNPSISTMTSPWWCARAQFLHQQLLKNPAAILYEGVMAGMQKVEEQDLSELPESHRKEFIIRAHVEHAVMMNTFGDTRVALIHTHAAQEASNLKMELTGALGRRTRFQTFDTAQLVLAARSGDVVEASSESIKPLNKALEDDTVLDDINFAGHVADQEGVSLLDQCTILASCLNIKNTNPKHGLTTEEMLPYVKRVLKETNTHNWLIYSMGLLLRSRLEVERFRTAERAVMQIQVLLDQFNDELGRKEASITHRMKYFYSIAFPSVLGLQRELGQRYLSLGVAKSALDLFERLEMWEEVIECMQVISDTKRALVVCERELDKTRTPHLLCVLGDLTGDKQHYYEAWELSGHRFARAMRTLGRIYMKEEKLDQCLECLGLALEINPQMEGVWFTHACAALKLRDFKTAANSFRRSVLLVDDNGEGWSNLATCYIRLGDKAKASNALQQAIRCNYENWMVWENYMHVCVDLKNVGGTIQAIHRIMDLKPEKFDDVEILRIVSGDVITRADSLEDGHEREKLIKSWQETLGRVTVVKTTSADAWTIVAHWHAWLGNLDKVVDSLQRAYRVAQVHGWQEKADLFTDVANRAITLTDAYFEQNTLSSVHSAKLMLRNLVKKTT
eukprot:Ihof_evm1s317 gene=Ihof_evmTU1s317